MGLSRTQLVSVSSASEMAVLLNSKAIGTWVNMGTLARAPLVGGAPREVLEHCLAHREGDETEKSYWTGEMKARRRRVLQAWADYIKPVKAAKAAKPSLTVHQGGRNVA